MAMKDTTKLFILSVLNSLLNGFMFVFGGILAVGVFYLVIK